MRDAAVVTGATGFVGSHLAAGILGGDADVIVICLARHKGGRSARERTLEAIRGAFSDGEGHEEPEGWTRRVIVIDHDLCAGGSGVCRIAAHSGRSFRVGAFWHCAASVEFTGQRGGTVWRANVDGLRGAVLLAEEFGSMVFNHVSTAYVAGRLTGRIAEVVDPRPRAYNNIYEESKHLCEYIVAKHCGASTMGYRIFRPSIVIGHSRTHRSSGGAGLYQAVDCVDRFARAMRARSSDVFRGRTLKVQVDREGTLDLMPVDVAVAEMLDLAALGSRTLGQVFHVTSESPVRACDVFGTTLELIGIDRFEVVGPEADLDYADRMFNRSLKSYAAYFGRPKIFERDNVARYGVDRHQRGYLLDVGRLRQFIGHHLAARRPATVQTNVGVGAPVLEIGRFSAPEVTVP
jgi:nucleoside-diphosphate-sugar epimerase